VPTSTIPPLLIFPCTIKSRSSLLAPAHTDGPEKRAVKQLWWWCGVGGPSPIFTEGRKQQPHLCRWDQTFFPQARLMALFFYRICQVSPTSQERVTITSVQVPRPPVCPLIFSLNLTHLAMDIVMVSHERIKGAELHPANTQLLRRVPEEAADVSANEWNAIQLELQQSCNKQPGIERVQACTR